MNRKAGLCALWVLAGTTVACAQGVTVTARVERLTDPARRKEPDVSNVVVWLTPLAGASAAAGNTGQIPRQHVRLLQKNKQFDPHILVVPEGSAVEFPNADPFFHNVFSLFEGKRFDLGLYEAGSSRTVIFDRPGICYIFCNIHPEMSAVVIVLQTPYYGMSDRAGRITIPNVPPGNYLLRVWDEGSLPEELQSLSREITVSESAHSLGTIRLSTPRKLQLAHKNKYGHDYESPPPPSPVYKQP